MDKNQKKSRKKNSLESETKSNKFTEEPNKPDDALPSTSTVEAPDSSMKEKFSDPSKPKRPSDTPISTTPKKVKRELYGELGVSPSKSKSSEFIGYVIGVSAARKSTTSGNSYFDIEFQTGENETKQIRVMVTKDYAPTQRSLYFRLKNQAQASKIKNISMSPDSGTYFINRCSSVENCFPHECQFSCKITEHKTSKISEILNCNEGIFTVNGKFLWNENEVRSPSSCSQSIRDGNLLDEAASIPVSIWEEHFPEIKDGSFYKFTNLKLRQFGGATLSTQRFTEISEVKAFTVCELTPKFNVICCPAILNCDLNIYPVCNNVQCKRKLNIPAGATIVSCGNCQRKLLVKNATVDINCAVQLEEIDESVQNVTVFRKPLEELFGKDLLKTALSDANPLCEKILSLQNHDFYRAKRGIVVIKIQKHTNEE